MERDTSQTRHAVDAIFKPATELLQRYSRYTHGNELEDTRTQLDGLRQDLLSAQSHGDIYEASCVRNELRELHQMIVGVIELYKS